MRNIALKLMYVGTAYHGWQVQKNAVSVAETLEEALAFYRDNAPKGEFVLVVAGRPPREMPSVTVEDGAEQVLALVARGVRLKDAARQTAEATGLSKNELYAAALARQQTGGDGRTDRSNG